MDHLRIAARIIEARRKPKKPSKVSRRKPEIQISLEPETMLKPPTEYSCRMEISLSADFEGSVSKKNLVKKLKNEVINAIKTGMEQVSVDLELHSTGVVVSPLRVECAVNDQSSVEDEDEFNVDEDEFEDEFEAPSKKKRRR